MRIHLPYSPLDAWSCPDMRSGDLIVNFTQLLITVDCPTCLDRLNGGLR